MKEGGMGRLHSTNKENRTFFSPILIGKSGGERQLGRPRRRWYNIIKMYFK
jgi:hypothetical protein